MSENEPIMPSSPSLFEEVSKRIRAKFEQPGLITFSGEDMTYSVDVLNDIAKDHGLKSYREFEAIQLAEMHQSTGIEPGFNRSGGTFEDEQEIPDFTTDYANYLKKHIAV